MHACGERKEKTDGDSGEHNEEKNRAQHRSTG